MPLSAATRCRARRAAALLGASMFTLACSGSGSGNAAESARGGRPSASAAAVATRTVADTTLVTVYKSPTCGCCKAWVDHLREHGFRVVAVDTTELDGIKRQHGVSQELTSCHTAIVGGYVVEGHVPASDIRRLLAERPRITGLAVPGMPQGSPGMETGVKEAYQVLAFTRGGGTSVFASH